MSASIRLLSSVLTPCSRRPRPCSTRFCIEACRDSSIRHALDVLDDRGLETRPTSPERSLSQEKLSASRSGTTHVSGIASPGAEGHRPKRGANKLLIVRRARGRHSDTPRRVLVCELMCDTVTPLLYRWLPNRLARPGLAWPGLAGRPWF